MKANDFFQTIPTELLCDIVNKKINPIELAIDELKNRGLNNKGKWVSFNPPEWWKDLYCPDGNCYTDADPGL